MTNDDPTGARMRVNELRQEAERASRLADMSLDSALAENLRRQAEVMNFEAGEIEAKLAGVKLINDEPDDEKKA